MADIAELRNVPAFSDLPQEQLAWFLSQCQELNLNAGEIYVRSDQPADAMYVLLEGDFQLRGELSGENITLHLKAGEVTGTLPFSRMKLFTMTGRAITAARALRFPASKFPELVQKMPELTTRLVGLMSDRIREATRHEQQRDRLASLGKLSAGLAHELNNPASAAKRAASQLRSILKRIRDASHDLGARELTAAQKSEIEKLEASVTQNEAPPPDPLTASELEDRIDSVLRNHGQSHLWQLSASLARKNFPPEALEGLFAALGAETGGVALTRIAASVEIAELLHEIESSTSRISELVAAIKEYTYMDQSPVQNVDIVKSLETTLTIMNHKLKRGVTVKREYQRVPLLVNSFGSELNQVWTNIIDNAIDAMGGKGELTVRTYREDGCVVVEIDDSGPGIPEEIQTRIFEPFFTTKGVGEGTGLGLDTVRRIVRKHNGNVQVNSHPGDTRFEIRLPLAEMSPGSAESVSGSRSSSDGR
ncbi:MAG TPA: ATP-binding protein [Verrucomicrobiae bacterium]|nr:ATP-binding protein [Verrucomicrobiae bacterium]